ncbi:MAG: hypothetical protein SGPRY_001219 [Prymnesium sp.]
MPAAGAFNVVRVPVWGPAYNVPLTVPTSQRALCSYTMQQRPCAWPVTPSYVVQLKESSSKIVSASPRCRRATPEPRGSTRDRFSRPIPLPCTQGANNHGLPRRAMSAPSVSLSCETFHIDQRAARHIAETRRLSSGASVCEADQLLCDIQNTVWCSVHETLRECTPIRSNGHGASMPPKVPPVSGEILLRKAECFRDVCRRCGALANWFNGVHTLGHTIDEEIRLLRECIESSRRVPEKRMTQLRELAAALNSIDNEELPNGGNSPNIRIVAFGAALRLV